MEKNYFQSNFLILGDLFLDYCINPYEGCEKKQKKNLELSNHLNKISGPD